MGKRSIRRKPADLRAELDAHPDDVIGHLDRSIPPAPPSAPPGKLSPKAEALRAWIEIADDCVEVKEADLDALLELGAVPSNPIHGSTYMSFYLYDGTEDYEALATCWVTLAGPVIPYGELQARHAAPRIESPLDVAAIAADAEVEGRITDAEEIRKSILTEAAA